MATNLFWILAVTGFIAQILCCIYGKNKLVRVLPMLVWVGIILLTLIASLTGLLTLILIVVELLILAVVVFAYILCKLVFFAKK